MRSRLLSLIGATLLALAGSSASAQITGAVPDDPDHNDESVRRYTNADLERLAPIPTQPGRPATPEEVERRWAFVQSVLDEAYARIDADRSYRLERRRTDAEADALERIHSRPRYVLPYNYLLGFRHGGVPGAPPRLRHKASRLFERPDTGLFRPIVPIHARPYHTSVERIRSAGATRRGEDRGR